MLHAFGAPTGGLEIADLAVPDQVVQLGASPYRIDLLTSIDGVRFDDAWPRRETVELDGLRVPASAGRT